MLGPAGTLTRSVTVMGEFALAALLQLLLSAETTVANAFGEAAEGRKEESLCDTGKENLKTLVITDFSCLLLAALNHLDQGCPILVLTR